MSKLKLFTQKKVDFSEFCGNLNLNCQNNPDSLEEKSSFLT